MTTLIDDTGVLLHLDVPDVPDVLGSISAVVIASISLKVKAQTYDQRVTDLIHTAYRKGYDPQHIAGAAGVSLEQVYQRLGLPMPALVPYHPANEVATQPRRLSKRPSLFARLFGTNDVLAHARAHA